VATLTGSLEEGGGRGERFLGRLRDRLIAADPAFSRLRLSSRAILSLLLSLALLVGVHFLLHRLSLAAFGMAVVISFLGAMGVTDKGARAQAVSRAYGFLIAVPLFVLAGLLAARPQLAFPVLLVVIFAAAYVRKFGQRWFGLGMVAFMAYFMGDYLRPAPADIASVASATALSFAVTHLVTTVILRDDPERDFRRALKTINRRINLILRALLETAERGVTAADRMLLQRHLDRLRDIVLMAEGFIPQGETGSLAAAGSASDLAVALFELQLVAERLVGFALTTAPPPADQLRGVLYRDGSALPTGTDGAAGSEGGESAAQLLRRVEWSRRRVEAVLGSTPSPAFSIAPGAAPGPQAGPAAISPRRLGWISIPRDFELPIQMTLACGIALSCGLLLSSVRWYWAVFAAFLVFSNAKSRADTALRALHRSAGAFAGLIGGTALATLLQGQPIVSGVLIPVLFFIGFYFVQTSYGTMMFCVTVGLALLYGIMGMFTPELLVLRLVETVIGAVAGTLVAFLVFPARASQTAATALEKYLGALGDLVAAAQRRAHGEPEPQHLLARSRLLDRSYTELANAVRPLGGPWSVVTRFGEVRERLLLLTACAHWGRVLARGLKPDAGLPAESVARVDTLVDEVRQRIGEAEAVRDAYFERPETAPQPPLRRAPLPVGNDEDPLFALEVISALLGRATRDPTLRRP
jgi:uncharacterized membrane protein YccC